MPDMTSPFLDTGTSTIKEGDTVVVYAAFGQLQPILVRRGAMLQTKYGALRHDFVLGKSFGTQVSASKGYLRLLRPTPSLWTQCLPHRTQILYPPDISLILTLLDVGPGSRVAEAGMGSGALSHALVRALAPTGRLYTYDVDAERLRKGAEEMREHRLEDFVTCEERNVCEAGFSETASNLDGVFLDVPMPWLAISAAKAALRKSGGRIVSFSPCVEQVQATCAKLRESGFIQLKTVELVPRAQRITALVWDDLDKELRAPKDDGGGEPAAKAPRLEAAAETAAPRVFPYTQPTHTGYLTSATLLLPAS